MNLLNVFQGWGKVLTGKVPILSIEITRECPLSCPGCYAYADQHLGAGALNLRTLADFRGDALVNGILRIVDEHQPLHVSLVGGEPLMRHRELSRVLPELSRRGIHALVVTSAVIPIPHEWMNLSRVSVAVSIDGNPEDHDVRRKPATYERILRNIDGRRVNVHWTIVRSNVERPGYMDRYLEFWNSRPEVNRIWVSAYTPQQNEISNERLTQQNRTQLAEYFNSVSKLYPKLLMNPGLMHAFLHPPTSPDKCAFAKLSTNYTADLKTRVEPCVFGGRPSCADCGCAMSMGMHWIGNINILGPLQGRHLISASMAISGAARNLAPSSLREEADLR